MLPFQYPRNRQAGIVRFGCVLTLLTICLSAGCSRFGRPETNFDVAPTLEMGREVSQDEGNTEPFALTNEGRRIEERLLDRQRTTWMDD